MLKLAVHVVTLRL